MAKEYLRSHVGSIVSDVRDNHPLAARLCRNVFVSSSGGGWNTCSAGVQCTVQLGGVYLPGRYWLSDRNISRSLVSRLWNHALAVRTVGNKSCLVRLRSTKGVARVIRRGSSKKNASGEWGEVEKSDAARYRDASIGESLLACPITWLMPLIQQNHFVWTPAAIIDHGEAMEEMLRWERERWF